MNERKCIRPGCGAYLGDGEADYCGSACLELDRKGITLTFSARPGISPKDLVGAGDLRDRSVKHAVG